jgi:uncharacterized protein (TIGR02453 family)
MTQSPQFTPETFSFLRELSENNDREWFLRNKRRYEAEVRDPMLALITMLGPHFRKTSPYLTASAKPNGGSMLRIYRDIRFSKDKSPFKTNIAAQFFHSAGKNEQAPGFYLHIGPGESFFGAGLWHPDPEKRNRVAAAIVAQPEDWRAATRSKQFRSHWTVSGESMKRMPRGFDPAHEFASDLALRDFVATMNFSDKQILDARFSENLQKVITSAAPFMKFLTHAVGFPWDENDPLRRIDPLRSTNRS